MFLLKLAYKSLMSRTLISALLVLSLSISIFLLMGIQKISYSAKTSFNHSLSDTDLIVGARTGNIQLLFFSIFHTGTPIANMSYTSLDHIAALPDVKWVIPLSLGDSHRGYPVLGTLPLYFKHYKYGKKQALSFKHGGPFTLNSDVVLGSKVAQEYGYRLGDVIHLSHGHAQANLPIHRQLSFTIVGILNSTGTPVDNRVHVSLAALDQIHHSTPDVSGTTSSITAALIGLKSRFSIFKIQRYINNWPNESLMAIIPGLTFAQLWSSIKSIDTAFVLITIIVMAIAFIGLLLSLFMALEQRQKELSILRVMGAHPRSLFALVMIESLLITLTACVLGIVLMLLCSWPINYLIEQHTGILIPFHELGVQDYYLVLGIISSGLLISMVPAYLSYRHGITKGFVSV